MISKLFSLAQTNIGRITLRYLFATRIINPIVRPFGFIVLTDYFYQPVPNVEDIKKCCAKERINITDEELRMQKNILVKLLNTYRNEFNDKKTIGEFGYNMSSSSFGSGDAEVLYSMIRKTKPKRVVEVGIGSSTQIIVAALKANFNETGIKTEVVSIDPFPPAWIIALQNIKLDFANICMLQKKVQECDINIFSSLQSNDILFIDSSHVFKQNSDVEFLFMKVYPSLAKDVHVHIHDIFWPNDYPLEWNIKNCQFWNEQYFLEVFLQYNYRFKSIVSLALVAHTEPFIFSSYIDRFQLQDSPTSFWMLTV